MLLGAIGADEGAMAISEDAALQQMEAELTEMFKRADAEGTGVLGVGVPQHPPRARPRALAVPDGAARRRGRRERGRRDLVRRVRAGRHALPAGVQGEAQREPPLGRARGRGGRDGEGRVPQVRGRAARPRRPRRAQVRRGRRRALGPPAARGLPALPARAAAHDAADGQHGRRVDAARRGHGPHAHRRLRQGRSTFPSLSRISRERSLSERSLAPSRLRQGDGVVHKDTIKKAVLEQMPSSALEKHLLTLFKEAELRQSGGDESKCSGTLASVDVSKLLAEAKHLNLSRQQLLAVMSLKDQCLAEHVEAPEGGADGGGGRRGGRGGRRGGRQPARVARRRRAPAQLLEVRELRGRDDHRLLRHPQDERRAMLASGAKMSSMNPAARADRGRARRDPDRGPAGRRREDVRPRARGALRAVIAACRSSSSRPERSTACSRPRFKTAGGDVRWREFASHAFETLMHVAHDREVARMEAAHAARTSTRRARCGRRRRPRDRGGRQADGWLRAESAPPAPAGGAAASAGGDGERGDAPAALVLTFSSVAETAEERKRAARGRKKAAAGGKGGRRPTARQHPQDDEARAGRRDRGGRRRRDPLADRPAQLGRRGERRQRRRQQLGAAAARRRRQGRRAREARAPRRDPQEARRRRPEVVARAPHARALALSRGAPRRATRPRCACRASRSSTPTRRAASCAVVGRVRLLRYADPDTGAPKETIWLVGTDCPVKPHAS